MGSTSSLLLPTEGQELAGSNALSVVLPPPASVLSPVPGPQPGPQCCSQTSGHFCFYNHSTDWRLERLLPTP